MANLIQSATPTVSVSPAYTAGDLVGTKMTLDSGKLRDPSGAVLRKISIADKGNQGASLNVLIFNADPSATTFTDNGAFSINAADISKLVNVVAVSSYSTFGSVKIGLSADLYFPLQAATAQTMYACLVAVGTPTYASTSDLLVTFNSTPA